jgi:hypothetical protein
MALLHTSVAVLASAGDRDSESDLRRIDNDGTKPTLLAAFAGSDETVAAAGGIDDFFNSADNDLRIIDVNAVAARGIRHQLGIARQTGQIRSLLGLLVLKLLPQIVRRAPAAKRTKLAG